MIKGNAGKYNSDDGLSRTGMINRQREYKSTKIE
jgi:hypothetical protein